MTEVNRFPPKKKLKRITAVIDSRLFLSWNSGLVKVFGIDSVLLCC